MAQGEVQFDFVAVKKPRKQPVIKQKKDGTILVRYEMTQEELNDAFKKVANKQCKKFQQTN